ncbi:MAG: rod shape-determining protein MreD [Spirochaetales bacterium]|nr:MAG: rod shape-determining protein MreD [Spirochaetales bacterium]
MRRIRFWVPPLILIGCTILQTTLLRKLSILGATPDLSLILLVFFANTLGSMRAQVTGFLGGIVEDVLSLSPLGFHTLIKTITGYLFGITKGKIFIDPIIIPIVLVLVASFLKAVLGILFIGLFRITVIEGAFSVKLWVEIGMNSLLAPFIFAFMKLFKVFKRAERE